MTRRNQANRAEKESRVQEALVAIRSGKTNCYEASKTFNVPSQTLYDRMRGVLARPLAQEQLQVLSHAEEKELVRWITRLTVTGYSPRHATLREMAEEIRARRVRNINDESSIYVEYLPIGKDWVKRFIRRHSELSSVTIRTIDASRIKAATPEAITHWFNELERVINEYNVTPENIYNMDESGFSIGEIEASKRIINAHIRQQFQAKPGRQEWVTSVECICADGTSLPPLIIFKAENLSHQWIPANLAADWKFSCNSKGWTSNYHGIEWLRRCFEPQTREKANGGWRLLICDGHDSHITGKWIGHCMDNNIHLMVLPPHSSHLTQPLDVSIFSPLKRVMASQIAPLISTGISRIQKAEWLSAFAQAHDAVFKSENVHSGFRGTGIVPFDPTKILRRIIPLISQTRSRQSTPPIDAPFNNSILTSSPIDINAVRKANTALNAIVATDEPINSPARKYLTCLTRSSERLHASNAILRKENERLQALVTTRKAQQSGKRKVIQGKHLLTTAEIRNAVLDAEKATKKRKTVRGTKARKRKAQDVSSSESESESEVQEDTEVEILDSIEVAFR